MQVNKNHQHQDQSRKKSIKGPSLVRPIPSLPPSSQTHAGITLEAALAAARTTPMSVRPWWLAARTPSGARQRFMEGEEMEVHAADGGSGGGHRVGATSVEATELVRLWRR
jgi:hypothetical protein